jgi:phage shock protein A
MRVFHRFTHTVSAGIESLLDQVENQEAVAKVTIRQIEEGAARVRSHRKRCERRIGELESSSSLLTKDSELWQERARRLRDDRDKALECVRRHLAAESARKAQAAELEQQRALRSKIMLDQQAIEAKLSELRNRCAALSSREARCNAQSSVASGGDIERIFDRWEARLDGVEGTIETAPAVDYFAESLTREEERARGEVELERLLSSSGEVSS